MKLTAKLIVNVVHHGLGVKKNVSSRLPKTALNSGFLPFYLTEKTSDLHLVLEDFYKKFVKELCKKSIEKNMCDSTYLQKGIIPACIEVLKMKLLPSAGTYFSLRSVLHIFKKAPLGKDVTRLDWCLITWQN